MTQTNNKFIVGIARCESYDQDEVRSALALAIERAGGLPEISCDSVLLKANMLAPAVPEASVTTHPEILRALIGVIRGAEGREKLPVHIADNPGYIFTNPMLLFEKTGIGALREMEGVSVGLLSDLGVSLVHRDSFVTLKEARIFTRYLESRYCINVAKLKTHVETEMTACIKNIFGTADTDTRKRSHRSISKKDLAEAISDLYTIRPPEFNIIDAVVGMEGDGPSHGHPRKLGFIIASRNALAADFVGAEVMCFKKPQDIPIIAAAIRRGVGPVCRDDIELNGASWEELPSRGFKKSSNMLRMLPVFLRGLAHSAVMIKPELYEPECISCWICEKVCPVDAISEEGKYPVIDKSACVRCLCCCEMCPTGAMKPKKNALAALVVKMRERDSR